MKEKKFVRKNTVWNVLASLFVILFMIAVVGNLVLVKFNLLEDITEGKLYARSWAADYAADGLKGFAIANIVDFLPAIGVAVGAFLLLLLPICFAKHGKGWNWIPLLLILADTVYFAKEAFNNIHFSAPDGILAYVKDVFSAPFERFLTDPDINLMFHVLVVLFLAFGAAKGTKKIPVVAPVAEEAPAEEAPAEEVAEEETKEEEKEEEPKYRTINLLRKHSPYARGTAFECWFNGENLSEISDAEEESFLVDKYGAELVVVSPAGEESNVISIPEGDDDETILVCTSRNENGDLRIQLVKA